MWPLCALFFFASEKLCCQLIILSILNEDLIFLSIHFFRLHNGTGRCGGDGEGKAIKQSMRMLDQNESSFVPDQIQSSASVTELTTE
jgi:hypothetical protein